jgi:hypothetical protein
MPKEEKHISASHWGMFPVSEETMDEFTTLVMEMRTAQRQYFKTRSTDWLHRSKELEREVDAAIEKKFKGQGSLV